MSTPKHKVFISYYHTDDQWYKNQLIQMKEFDSTKYQYLSAKDNGNFIIPVACFGGAAKQVWDELSKIDSEFTKSIEIKELNDATKALEAIQKIIANISNGAYTQNSMV